MKRLLTLFVLLAFLQTGWSQPELQPVAKEIFRRSQARLAFQTYDGLFVENKNKQARQSVAASVEYAMLFDLQKNVLQQMYMDKPEDLVFSMPGLQGNMQLRLYLSDIYAEGFTAVTSSGKTLKPEGLHYRGIVNEDPSTLVGLSIYDNEVIGIISEGSKNHVLGRLDGKDTRYILYDDSNLKDFNPLTCQVNEDYIRAEEGEDNHSHGRTAATKCVNVYWEVDYPVYQDKRGNTLNYITGLFNQSKILFDNDGISVKLSQILIWDSPSPYGNGSSGSRLSNFRNYRTSYNGDLAHLIGYGGGGGVAYVRALCGRYSYAYSGIGSSYRNVPAYSWSVMVVTHEQGHVMGSPHTHDCAWNGNNTAIDGCYNPGGGCARPGYPANGGTIMSYCHLVQGVGINLANGFGPQPRQRIRDYVNSRSCLQGSCGGGGNGQVLADGEYRIRARHSGKVLDVDDFSTSNGANVLQWTDWNTDNQIWNAEYLGDSQYRLTARHSGKVLDVAYSSSEPGTNVHQWSWNGTNAQRWIIEPAGSTGYFKLRSVTNGLYLDVAAGSTQNGANIVVWTGHNGTNQQFSFDPVSAAALSSDLVVEDDFILYPNPADHLLEIAGLKRGDRVAIYNLSGVALLETVDQPKVDVSSLSPGMYLVKIQSGEQLVTRKLMVER